MKKNLIKTRISTRDEDKSMKRQTCDPKKVMKHVRFYLATSEVSEDTSTQTLDD
jgi:hypothetical protein